MNNTELAKQITALTMNNTQIAQQCTAVALHNTKLAKKLQVEQKQTAATGSGNTQGTVALPKLPFPSLAGTWDRKNRHGICMACLWGMLGKYSLGQTGIGNEYEGPPRNHRISNAGLSAALRKHKTKPAYER